MSRVEEAARVAHATDASRAVTVIRPSKGWIGIDFGELWRYRELFAIMVWRDVKVKYKQTLLGFAWAVLVPFCQMLVFCAIALIGGLESDGLPKVVFYFTNMVIWSYFATAVTMSSNSLVGSAQLLTKIYFPRLIVPAAPCLAGFVDFFFAFMLLMGVMAYYHIVPPIAALMAPLCLALAFGTALGVGLILSALNVKYRDIRYVIPPLVQMWMFGSVVLSFSDIYDRLHAKLGAWCYVYALNPMAGVIEGFRWCLLHHKMSVTRSVSEAFVDKAALPETLEQGQAIVARVGEDGAVRYVIEQTVQVGVEAPWILLAIGTPVTGLLLVFGLYYFKRMEKMFADIV